jgi:predicted dehydrogenase
MDKKEIRIGLIGGCGRIGKLHGNNLAHSVPGAKLVAVSDPFLNEKTIAWAQALGVSADRCFKDEESIFAAPDIDAVFICSPTSTHADFYSACGCRKKGHFLREADRPGHQQNQKGAGRCRKSRRHSAGWFCAPL